ncbi:xylulokinase [Anaerolineae bacterium CFX9]|nr:xylulokinase [Anaerolineae bacterium CFX9]
MTKQYVLAHDLGTTGDKASLYDRDGMLIGSALFEYGVSYPQTGYAEQNVEDWWNAVCGSTQKLLRMTNVRGEEIACIVFSGQMMGCVPLDEQARPLRNAIIWADTRSVAQEHWVGTQIAPERVYRITGHRLSASYSLCKILWLRDHQRDIYDRTYKFVHAKDAMIARLTGRFITEPSDASSMNLYDLDRGTWSDEIITAAGLDGDKLPEIIPSTGVAGEVLPQIAAEIGVPAGTPVVAGGGDGSCAGVGAGVVSEGAAYNYVGSSSWIALASPHPIYDPDLKTFTFAHLMPGMFMPTGTMQAAGASYQWARNELCQVERQAAQNLNVSAYELMNMRAQGSPPGANGLIYLPYLLGERSPRWNPKARGAYIGLTIRHTHADIIRATLEGITFNLRVILDAFRAQGAQISAMRVIGGGARGRFWNMIMAAIFGMPIHRLTVLEEATSMGAALAGGIGVGLYPGWEMIEQMNSIAETIAPDPAAQAAYERLYPIFDQAYSALLPIYDALAELS